jgi:hypothetical protein
MSATLSRVLLGTIVSLVGHARPAVADDAEVSQAGFDIPWCRSSAHDTVDLLLSSNVYVFDSNELKSIKFTAKARVARWNLKTGVVLETTIPYGEHFHVADGHVFPK